MSLILSLETSASLCSVALHLNGQLLLELQNNELRAHAKSLVPMIEKILTETNLTYKQLDAIAISSGPGSYTGLRIASSTAKGLCYALEVPLIAVGTLQALAMHHRQPNKMTCPLIDARRMEVYTCLYDSDGEFLAPVSAMVIDSNSFEDLLATNQIIFCGDAVDKCKPYIIHPNATFCSFVPTASMVGHEAFKAYQQNQFVDVAYFEPFYLKEFVVLSKKASAS